jgi:anti-anti-sigma factor
MSEFAISMLRADAAIVWLSLAGDFDLAAVPAVQQALAEAESTAPATLLLDLSLLSFMDSSGLHCILDAKDSAGRAGTRLALVAGPSNVQRLFEVTGVDQHVEFVARPVLEEALGVLDEGVLDGGFLDDPKVS